MKPDTKGQAHVNWLLIDSITGPNACHLWVAQSQNQYASRPGIQGVDSSLESTWQSTIYAWPLSTNLGTPPQEQRILSSRMSPTSLIASFQRQAKITVCGNNVKCNRRHCKATATVRAP